MTDLTDQLDEAFSKYIRLYYADWKGEVSCYTCTWRGRWQDADCGHFVPRKNLQTRWEEDNCRVQCRECNRVKNGSPKAFEEELREELGDERVDELIASKHKETRLDAAWLNERIIHYSGLANSMRVG